MKAYEAKTESSGEYIVECKTLPHLTRRGFDTLEEAEETADALNKELETEVSNLS